jgi:hypothetical protein
VLKNTYSKKNRPNNSKSVAIGSRSQGLRKSQIVSAAQELLDEFDKNSLLKRQSDITERESFEFELSHKGGISAASLPVVSQRQIQSAGGKRNK